MHLNVRQNWNRASGEIRRIRLYRIDNKEVPKFEMKPPRNQLGLEFEIEVLNSLLRDGASDAGVHSHYQIADWCLRMSNRFHDDDCEEAFDHALSIAATVECQWDLFVASKYSTKDQQEVDPDKIFLPREWFADWLALLQGGESAEEPEQGEQYVPPKSDRAGG